MLKNKFTIKSILVLMVIASFFNILFLIKNKTKVAKAGFDVISIRVYKNSTDRLSAYEWYKQLGVSGSPQSLIVDGYNAVRSGNTVFVNAGATFGNKLYTNIYIISYNLNSEQSTKDIFSQILESWTFNTEIENPYGFCLPSKIIASPVNTKTTDIFTLKKSIEDNGFDLPNNISSCRIDSDCPSDYLCSGEKARVVRDTKRLEGIFSLRKALDDYYFLNKNYPKFLSGSFVKYNTLSTWESWESTDTSLAKILGVNLPKDPVNHLGLCPKQDQVINEFTCWTGQDDVGKLIIPENSYIIHYKYDENNDTAEIKYENMEWCANIGCGVN